MYVIQGCWFFLGNGLWGVKKDFSEKSLHLLGSGTTLLGLLGQERVVDVGEDTTLGNGDMSEQLVQLLIVTDGQLQVAGNDTGLLVIASGVTGQLEDLSGQVLEDGSEVDGGTGTDTLGIVTLAQVTVDTTDGELKTGLGRAGGRVLGSRSRLATGFAARHCNVCCLLGLKVGEKGRRMKTEKSFERESYR